MTFDLRPYPEYKDSGLPWIGQVPEHWNILRLKWVCRFAYGDSLASEVRNIGKVPVFGSNGCIGYHDAPNTLAPCVIVGRKGSFGKVNFSADAAFAIDTTYFIDDRFSKADLKWLSYVLKWARLDDASRDSAIPGLDRGEAYNRRLPVPPSEEQKAIVNYLDGNAVKVGRFIHNRRRLIEVLNEQKQSIINRTVTRGLDPDVSLKPSGIKWLGDIPEHWEVCRLRNVVSQVTSGPRGWSACAADEGPLFLRIANLRRMSLQLKFDDVIRLNLPETSEAKRTQVQGGDILVSITAYIGSIAVVPSDFEEAYVSQHVALCRPRDDRHNPLWLGYVLLSEVGQIYGRLSLYGGTKDGLSLDDVKNYPLFLPPHDEQDKLVEHIECQLEAVEAAIGRAEREIELIQEYRARMVADVVTGQLDVRQTPVTVQPIRPNINFYRSVLAAEIVEQHQGNPKFGWIKLQKAMILAERHLRLDEIQSQPMRAAAGPFDNQMMRSIHAQIERQKWFKPVKLTGSGYEYVAMEKRGGHRQYFDRYWANKRKAFDDLIGLIKQMTTKQIEIVATIFMAWNDFLLRCEGVDDDKLIAEILNNWDESKRSIGEDRWRKAIAWMKKKGLVPHGFGSLTLQATKRGNNADD